MVNGDRKVLKVGNVGQAICGGRVGREALKTAVLRVEWGR